MIEIVSGDMFKSSMQTITNPINCCGVMGGGLALAFKQKFPDMFKDYVNRCSNKQVAMGRPYVYIYTKPLILNFPTKYHWRDNSTLEDIKNGLYYLIAMNRVLGIKSLAIPALGCGLGQLDWKQVQPLMSNLLSKLDIPVEIYEPQ